MLLAIPPTRRFASASQLLLRLSRTFFVQAPFRRPQGQRQTLDHAPAVSPGRQRRGGGYGFLRCWDLATGKESLNLDVPKTPYAWSLAFSKDGKRLLAGYDDYVARVFDMTTGKVVGQFTGHTASIWAAAFLADGKQAITGSWDRSLRLWDVDTGKEIRAFDNVRNQVRCLAIRPMMAGKPRILPDTVPTAARPEP